MTNALHKLFLDELADIHYAELQLTKTLPKLAKTAENDELREAFENHLRETETHISRIEEIFEMLDEKPRKKKCEGMEGILDEGKEMLSDNKGSAALDAALIAAAQKVEHYEIASYGTLATWAKLMEHDDVAKLLNETLDEEKAADEKLTEVAESLANLQAAEAEA
jgi:ferritin-like metal-binding protein YciE